MAIHMYCIIDKGLFSENLKKSQRCLKGLAVKWHSRGWVKLYSNHLNIILKEAKRKYTKQ